MNRNSGLTKLLKKNRQLFWDVGENDLYHLSQEAITERFMAFGNMSDIHKLEKVISKPNLLKIFDKLISKKRINLEPETLNFFNLYLHKNVS